MAGKMHPRSALSIVALVSLFNTPPAFACINESATSPQGFRVSTLNGDGKRLMPLLVTPATKAALTQTTWQVVAMVKQNPSFYNLNNLAAMLIRHGRLDDAIRLLQFLERQFPAQYQTASNMGTAYELMGRHGEALTWILEGMKRNPDDHYGTEWLHVQILRAKLGQLGKPAPGRSILNLDFGTAALPHRPGNLPLASDGKPRSLFNLGLALRYQLLERIQFVAAPDPMVAGLLLDWANLELVAGTVESAAVLYDAALRYGSHEGATIAARKREIAKVLAKADDIFLTQERMAPCEICIPSDYPSSAK